MRFRRVCFFLPSANRDGAELCALECMDALQALGMQCHVIAPKKGPLLAEFEARQISYQIIPYKVWIEPPVPVWQRLLVALWNLAMTYCAVFLVGRRPGDLIVTNTINICVGALVAGLLGLPHVWYIHEFGHEDHGWRYHLGEKPSLGIMNRLSALCLAVSKAVAQKYQARISPAKMRYLYQPVEVAPSGGLEAIPGKQPFQLTCVMVGGLQEGKRQEDAVRALVALRDQGVLAQLWLVGGGDRVYTGLLKNLVRENNLGEQVTFVGPVDNPFPYIKEADVLLLCSRCEAFGRVTVEAMKAGKPVIGTGCGGTLEIIEDGFNGFLYEPQNHQELAEKIKYLLDHPEEAQKMGQQAQQWALRTFTPERYREELAGILEQLAKGLKETV